MLLHWFYVLFPLLTSGVLPVETQVQRWVEVLRSEARYTTAADREEYIRAIVAAEPAPEEQATMLAVAYMESTFRVRRTFIPFGYQGARAGTVVAVAAIGAARVFRRCHRACRRHANALSMYHHGNSCQEDGYGRIAARVRSRFLASYVRQSASGGGS